MQQPPGHGADLVEELQGGHCISARHGTCEAENPQMAIHLTSGSIGNTPVVGSIALPSSPAPLQIMTGTETGSGSTPVGKSLCELGGEVRDNAIGWGPPVGSR